MTYVLDMKTVATTVFVKDDSTMTFTTRDFATAKEAAAYDKELRKQGHRCWYAHTDRMGFYLDAMQKGGYRYGC